MTGHIAERLQRELLVQRVAEREGVREARRQAQRAALPVPRGLLVAVGRGRGPVTRLGLLIRRGCDVERAEVQRLDKAGGGLRIVVFGANVQAAFLLALPTGCS